ncbi:hypothetical protein PV797_01795 [Clostridiaceae bacterium M8S5]|nr:hypothetical protein PV797_01795 [Clostridiaceae bacterium M8S5]
MKKQYKILITIMIVLILILVSLIIIDKRRISAYEKYLTDKIQEEFRVIDSYFMHSYNILNSIENGEEISVEYVKTVLIESIRNFLYEFQRMDGLITLSDENNKNIMKKKNWDCNIYYIERVFEQSYRRFIKEGTEKVSKENFIDKKAINDYYHIVKDYIKYKTEKYDSDSDSFRFIQEFKFKDNSWIYFYNDVNQILYQKI